MTMNFFGKKSSQNEINYKSRLEHKLYLAREDPEPVFDLSECNLKNVPSGVYSLCKVFRKEILLLQINQLSSLSGGGNLSDLHLLTHLDLHKNHLTSLSEDIVHLTNLKVLNLSFNRLKKLPEAMGCLVELKTLDCSHNKLESLPPSLGQLKLVTLDLRANPKLSSVTCSLNVANLVLDECTKHDLSGNGELAAASTQPTQYNSSTPMETREGLLSDEACSVETHRSQDSFTFLEKKKEEKQKELLQIEKSLLEQKTNEFKRHESLKLDKNKLISDLKEQQKKLEEDVNRFQLKKDEERTKLLNQLIEVENKTYERIEDLISLSQALRQSSHWQEQDAREKALWDEYKQRSHQLRHQEVIDAMEFLLAEECARKAKLMEYEKNKSQVIQDSILREVEWRGQVDWLLNVRDSHQNAVVAAVETDTEVQKALVATLLERSDMRSRALVMQVALTQHQLAVLTDVELRRKEIDSEHHLNDLAEKRKALSELLVELLRDQQERRRQLTNQLQELESDKQLSGSTDFWLRQYQRLLDLRPPQLRRHGALDPALVHEVVSAGAAHCLPFLTCCDIDTLSATQLAQIGVTSAEDQAAVMGAVSAYQARRLALVEPSAPPASPDHLPSAPDHLPSAPPLPPPLGSECVVCLETMCDVVFVPCGHLCTCSTCASHLLLCPLCRASIQRKIHVFI